MATRAHTMAVARDPTTGAALLSATVNVYNPGTVTPISATIFDKNGNTLANPLTSDPVTGLIDFYLNVAQEVDLLVAKAGYTSRTYSNVPVIDDASFDSTALLTTTGDMPYAPSANTPARLPVGVVNALLQVAAGIPAWVTTILGALTFSGKLTLSGGIRSASATGVSVPNSTATTVIDLTTVVPAFADPTVGAMISVSGAANAADGNVVGGIARINCHANGSGAWAFTVGTTEAVTGGVSFSISGNNLQVTQTSGATRTMNFVLLLQTS